jgi:hypothetical protein
MLKDFEDENEDKFLDLNRSSCEKCRAKLNLLLNTEEYIIPKEL